MKAPLQVLYLIRVFLVVLFLIVSPHSLLFRDRLMRNLHSLTSLSLAKPVNSLDLLGESCACPEIVGDVPTTVSRQNLGVNEVLETGRWYFYHGEYQKALLTLQQASPDHERRQMIDFFIGASYLCLDDGKQAAQYWKQEALAWHAFTAIRSCQLADQPTRAAALYDLALSSQPGIWDGWHMGPKPIFWTYEAAARLAGGRGDDLAQLHWLELSLADYPHSHVANYRLGDFYERRGDLRRAQKYYQQGTLYAPPYDVNLYLHFARVSLGLGEWDTGADAIETLLTEKAPESEWHWHVVEWLVRNHTNPVLCRRMDAMMNQIHTPVAGEIATRMANIRKWCGN